MDLKSTLNKSLEVREYKQQLSEALADLLLNYIETFYRVKILFMNNATASPPGKLSFQRNN